MPSSTTLPNTASNNGQFTELNPYTTPDARTNRVTQAGATNTSTSEAALASTSATTTTHATKIFDEVVSVATFKTLAATADVTDGEWEELAAPSNNELTANKRVSKRLSLTSPKELEKVLESGLLPLFPNLPKTIIQTAVAQAKRIYDFWNGSIVTKSKLEKFEKDPSKLPSSIKNFNFKLQLSDYSKNSRGYRNHNENIDCITNTFRSTARQGVMNMLKIDLDNYLLDALEAFFDACLWQAANIYKCFLRYLEIDNKEQLELDNHQASVSYQLAWITLKCLAPVDSLKLEKLFGILPNDLVPKFKEHAQKVNKASTTLSLDELLSDFSPAVIGQVHRAIGLLLLLFPTISVSYLKAHSDAKKATELANEIKAAARVAEATSATQATAQAIDQNASISASTLKQAITEVWLELGKPKNAKGKSRLQTEPKADGNKKERQATLPTNGSVKKQQQQRKKKQQHLKDKQSSSPDKPLPKPSQNKKDNPLAPEKEQQSTGKKRKRNRAEKSADASNKGANGNEPRKKQKRNNRKQRKGTKNT
jgi:hypothetical protein